MRFSFLENTAPVGAVWLTALLFAACTESPVQTDRPGNGSEPPPVYLDTSFTDFAPLQVGNTWTYHKTYYGRRVCDYQSQGEQSIVTVVLGSREQRGDASLFRLTIRDSTTVVGGSRVSGPVKVTADSLLETAAGIVANGRFPFFEVHLRADSTLRERYSWNGVSLRAYSDSAESFNESGAWYDNKSWKKTFAQDLGLVRYSQQIRYHGWNGNELCTDSDVDYFLRDFKAGPAAP